MVCGATGKATVQSPFICQLALPSTTVLGSHNTSDLYSHRVFKPISVGYLGEIEAQRRWVTNVISCRALDDMRSFHSKQHLLNTCWVPGPGDREVKDASPPAVTSISTGVGYFCLNLGLARWVALYSCSLLPPCEPILSAPYTGVSPGLWRSQLEVWGAAFPKKVLYTSACIQVIMTSSVSAAMVTWKLTCSHSCPLPCPCISCCLNVPLKGWVLTWPGTNR